MSDRAVSQCDTCGGNDDHPKDHLGVRTYHHDCIPFAERQAIAEGNPRAAKVIAAAESGIHGPELLAFIQSLDDQGVQ